MAVGILYSVEQDLAVMFCSSENWSIGPVIDGPDADEKAKAFRQWFLDGSALQAAGELYLSPRGILGMDGDDPRDWTETDLERLFIFWRERYVDDDGCLLETAVAS